MPYESLNNTATTGQEATTEKLESLLIPTFQNLDSESILAKQIANHNQVMREFIDRAKNGETIDARELRRFEDEKNKLWERLNVQE